MSVYDFTVLDNQQNPVPLGQYKGKVLLFVNTATKCGLTPQYEELEKLYEKYKGQGFEILDFPCNQFLKQAPGTDEEIQEFCTLQYNTTFPRFAKIEVNGEEASPLYVYLKQVGGEDQGDDETKSFEKKVRLLKPFAKEHDIKWNFGKFLVNRQGEVIGRYSPAFKPEQLEESIQAACVASVETV